MLLLVFRRSILRSSRRKSLRDTGKTLIFMNVYRVMKTFLILRWYLMMCGKEIICWASKIEETVKNSLPRAATYTIGTTRRTKPEPDVTLKRNDFYFFPLIPNRNRRVGGSGGSEPWRGAPRPHLGRALAWRHSKVLRARGCLWPRGQRRTNPHDFFFGDDRDFNKLQFQ